MIHLYEKHLYYINVYNSLIPVSNKMLNTVENVSKIWIATQVIKS